ncbi:hypothetical protein EJ07DRAFT_166537 [Lizonia empirigonia]|nr:hypothetical protein EJ07DRAFT_166537 [Lizonia empirigonia]
MLQLPEDAAEILPRDATYEPLGNGFFRLTLSRENKTEIFEYALSKLTQSQSEASAILQNLAKWDPPTAALFSLRSPATILDTPFRLIFPNSARRSFDETGLYIRQYTAVSYCWRSAEFLPEGYERYGDWPISKPFVDAILEDKGHPRQGIWMDQLCIDQPSAVDKQRSVAAMDTIYQSCLRMLVLLEDVSRHDRVGSQVKYEYPWVPPVEERSMFVRFYHKIIAACWWGRAWCHHEFSVNEPWSEKRMRHEVHNATFIVNGPEGSTVKIKWYTLHWIMVTALESSPELISTATTDAGQAIFTSFVTAKREPGLRSSLMARHNGVSQKGSLYLKDKLSVMINMCGLGLAYQGQAISTREEVLYFSVLLALAAGEVYPLTMFHATWLQWHIAADDTTIPKFKPRDLQGIHHVTKYEIGLDMIFLRPLCQWVDVDDLGLRLTYEIFPETIRSTRPDTDWLAAAAFLSGSDPDTESDTRRRPFLASCIVQGHSFMARLWAQLKNDVVTTHYNQGTFKDLGPSPDLYAAARRLMAQLAPITILLCISPPSSFTLDDAQLFLTWLSDPRLMYYIGVFTYLVQCRLDGWSALVTSMHTNEHFDNGPWEELRAAMPTHLAGGSCVPLRNGLEKWRLVGKAILLGEPDLMIEVESSAGEEGGVVQLKRAVIGG